jgi:phosphate transport system substrate-binding protein
MLTAASYDTHVMYIKFELQKQVRSENVRLAGRIIPVVLFALLIVISSSTLGQDQSVAELVAGNPDLSVFHNLASQAGIALSGTIYAPTNTAFSALPQFVTDYIAGNPELLGTVVQYHVAGDNSALIVTTAANGSVQVDNALVVTPAISASDGTLNIVDSVLVPEIALPEVIPADVFGDITLAGSSTVFPITQTIAADFAAEGFAGEITADSIGTGAGFERFCTAEGASDIANASRAIRNSEIEACAAGNQREPVGFLVGSDGLAVVVNPANDYATDLTHDELMRAFSTATTWADVRPGFPECEILRFSPGTDSGTFDFFVEEVFSQDEAPILNASNLNLSEDDNVLLDGVANNECAIGYFGYAYYSENSDLLTLVAIDGVLPETTTVDDGSYSLARPLYIYAAPSVIAEKPQVGEFLAYYLSRVPDVTPSVGYFLPNEYDFNTSRLVLLAMLSAAAGGM